MGYIFVQLFFRNAPEVLLVVRWQKYWIFPFICENIIPNWNLRKWSLFSRRAMILIQTIKDLFPSYPILIESLKNWCTNDLNLSLVNLILNSCLYGFRRRHTTHRATLDINSTIQHNMNNKLFSCGIFIDLKKAFDTVNYNVL